MQRILPLNRREKFWTSSVLPIVICGETGFCDLYKFLEMIGVPSRFTKESYEDHEIDFNTEYCLRDSALDWNVKISGETPDLVIVLNINGELYLIFVEAKMFDSVTSKKVRRQLDDQKKIKFIMMEKLGIKESNFSHVVLFLQCPNDFSPQKEERVLNWNDICDEYKHKAENYFYKKLKMACQSTDLISRGADTYGENSTGKLKCLQIVSLFNEIGDFYVGRQGNIDQVAHDCVNGRIRSFQYEVNTKLKPGIDNPPGLTGKWWFRASDYIDVLKKYQVI